MRIGRLDKRVVLEAPVHKTGALGGVELAWEERATRWASIEGLAGLEVAQGNAVEGRATHKLRLYFVEGLSVRWRVRYGSRVFNVTGVRDVFERHFEHELTAVEVVPAAGSSPA